MLSCIDSLTAWAIKTFLSSDFFSTVLGLAVGSWWIARCQARRASEEDMLRWLIEKIDAYSRLAYEYWNLLLKEELDLGQCSELSSRLKVEIKFFYATLNHLHIIKKSEKGELKTLIRGLYHGATGGKFETLKHLEYSEVHAAHQAVANASAELRKRIYDSIVG